MIHTSIFLRVAFPAVCVSMASAWSCHIRPSGADEYDTTIHVHARWDECVVSGDAQLSLSDVMKKLNND